MRLATIAALTLAATSAQAHYTIQMSKGVEGGVSETQITHSMLTPKEEEGIKMMASVYAWSRVANVNAKPGQTVTVSSWHTVCFETLFTTEADYVFTLDAGGKQSVVKNHIVIPGHERTCVSHQLYMNVAFASPGRYQYFGRSNGITVSSGNRGVVNSAFVFVQ